MALTFWKDPIIPPPDETTLYEPDDVTFATVSDAPFSMVIVPVTVRLEPAPTISAPELSSLSANRR